VEAAVGKTTLIIPRFWDMMLHHWVSDPNILKLRYFKTLHTAYLEM
jgi:hypothetical protein